MTAETHSSQGKLTGRHGPTDTSLIGSHVWNSPNKKIEKIPHEDRILPLKWRIIHRNYEEQISILCNGS